MKIFMKQRLTDEQDFLPAALEVMEKPPSPAGRAIIWSIILLFGASVMWAFIGEVDIVTVASGKIVPSGRVKAVQAAQLGVVSNIHVSEGRQVEAGQLLVELDPSVTEAERRRLSDALAAVTAERQRLQRFSDTPGKNAGPGYPFTEITDGRHDTGEHDSRVLSLQGRILADQWAEYTALRTGMEKKLAGNHAEQEGVRVKLEKLDAILPLITERAGAMKKMLDRDLAPRIHWSELEQERVETEKETGVLKHRQHQLQAIAGMIVQDFATEEARLLKSVHTQLAELDREIASLGQELVKAEALSRRQQLIAPVSGTVHRMTIHTVGGVVKPAEPLMYIVPDDAGLEVEAWVRNKDIGFVANGQQTEVKIETFPFTKYGTIPARIAGLSHDAVTDEEHGLVYRAKIILLRSTIRVGNHLVNLAPGMAVTAEVKTGKRRMIEYLLSPLLRYRDEFARER